MGEVQHLPLFLAPLICTASSGALFSAINMPIFSRLRCCFSRPGRVQAYPQHHSVTSFCPSAENSVEPFARARLTYSSPTTLRRILRPSSKSCLWRPSNLGLVDIFLLSSVSCCFGWLCLCLLWCLGGETSVLLAEKTVMCIS